MSNPNRVKRDARSFVAAAPPGRVAAGIAILYLAVGAVWTAASEHARATFRGVSPLLEQVHAIEDWLYLLLTASLAFLLVRWLLQRRQATGDHAGGAGVDRLTGLPNRDQLLELLCTSAARKRHWGTLLLVDIDGFRRINDALGPGRADELLVALANLLRLRAPAGAHLARVSSDVFAVLVEAAGDDAAAALDAARVLAVEIGAGLPGLSPEQAPWLTVTACFGVSLSPIDEADGASVLARAETALHRAQEEGPDRLCVFDVRMQAEAEMRLALAARLRHALDADELTAYLQPQCNADGRIVGAEVLARWRLRDGHFISPAEFIPIAEASGLIGRLGEQMLEAAAQLSLRLRAHGCSVPLAVNLSAKQLLEPDFLARVDALLLRSGADPRDLTLEVTESLMIEGFDAAVAVLEPLRARGFRIALDDFGTGFSSLSYLKQLPVDELKIDGSFIRDSVHDPRGRALVEAIVAVGKVLSLQVVAEGVESQEQVTLLHEFGCRVLQGYLFGRPMPVDEFERAARKSAVVYAAAGAGALGPVQVAPA
jgi:diguanylate cyclase (GGDEF)-like protein